MLSVSTTVFITHCFKKARRTLERALLALGLWLLSGLALAGMAEIEQLRVERQDGALLLQASLKLELGPAVEDALLKGVPVNFVAEAELLRDRWYWYDQKLAQVNRHYRLVYQPLTRQWRLQVASEPIAAGVAGSSLAQTFESLQGALEAVRRQVGWKLLDAAELEPDARQYLNYRFRLDISQLPRPFQIAAGNQSDWALSVSRTLRLQPER